mmetsp:Transcript_11677/g.43508  ORF Transcript_11677/g.43508 Transcript_11677/m.43508 type:complete len:210 (-) Transcript_11677:30-659(-)
MQPTAACDALCVAAEFPVSNHVVILHEHPVVTSGGSLKAIEHIGVDGARVSHDVLRKSFARRKVRVHNPRRKEAAVIHHHSAAATEALQQFRIPRRHDVQIAHLSRLACYTQNHRRRCGAPDQHQKVVRGAAEQRLLQQQHGHWGQLPQLQDVQLPGSLAAEAAQKAPHRCLCFEVFCSCGLLLRCSADVSVLLCVCGTLRTLPVSAAP